MLNAVEKAESSLDLENVLDDCYSQQLSEFELLKSMYPDDIILSDNGAFKSIHEFIQNKSEYTPNHLDYVVNIMIGSIKLEVSVNLPSLYPQEEPDLYVRSNQLNRYQQTKINTLLNDYIKSHHYGDVCIYTAISWLQDNIEEYIDKEVPKNQDNDGNCKPQVDMFSRLWIYSHHIYNKKKREEIVKRAKQLQLTGFCLPGKPGVICIEGAYTDCLDWWKDIKSMSWKRIVLKSTEIYEPNEQKLQQRFQSFEEITFKSQGSNTHSDMGEFSRFLEMHGLTKALHEIFSFGNDT